VQDAATIRVVIVEDHTLVREGLRSLLTAAPDIEVAGYGRCVAEALEVIEATSPHVVLLDLRLGEEDGLEVSRSLSSHPAGPEVLVLSAHERPSDLRAALNAGATGYLLKHTTPRLLVDAVRRVSGGHRVIDQAFVPLLVGLPSQTAELPDLTPREQQVLDLVAEGLANREIGERLGIARSTAQKHLESLFRKFDVHDRSGLVAKAFRSRYLE